MVRREVISLDQACKISQGLARFSVEPSQFYTAKGLADNQTSAQSRAAHLQRMARHQQRIKALLTGLYSAGPALDAAGHGQNTEYALLKSTDYSLSLYKGLRSMAPVAAAFALYSAEVCEVAVQAQLLTHADFLWWVEHDASKTLTPEAIANKPPSSGPATPTSEESS
jgi:hypothetical protein